MRRSCLLRSCAIVLALAASFSSYGFAQYNLKSISYLFPALPAYGAAAGDPLPGDYNNDGHIDIAIPMTPGSFTGSGFILLLGSGLGAFNVQSFIAPPSDPCAVSGVNCSYQGLEKGDFNRDGNLDLVFFETVTTGTGANAISTHKAYLFLGKGDGTFQAANDISKYLGPNGRATVIDVRENGILDLLSQLPSSSTTTGGFQIAWGNGDGTFQDPVPVPCPNKNCGGAYGLADLGNGHMDLVYAIDTGYAVMLGKGDGTFQKAIEYPNTVPQGMYGSDVYQIVFGNFSPNHRVGMVMLVDLASFDEVYAAEVYNGNGNGTFAEPIGVNSASGEELLGGVAVADINNDGVDDLIFSQAQGYDYPTGFQWTLANGDGTFASPVTLYTSTDTCGSIQGDIPPIQPADITGSGWRDIVSYYPATSYSSACLFLAFNTNGPRAATTTVLTSSNSAQTFPGTVTLEATVTANSPAKYDGPTVPPGGVDLYNNGTLMGSRPLKSGVATFANLVLPVGYLNLTATYRGEFFYLSSSSEPLDQVMLSAPAHVTATFTPSNLMSVFSNPVTIAVQVTGQFTDNGKTYIPTGGVNFYFNNKLLGTRALVNGTATLTANGLPVGGDYVYAAYTGDDWFEGDNEPSAEFYVSAIPTSISLVSSANPSTAGSAVTFTATISRAAAPDTAQPNGYLHFYDGATEIGSGFLQSGIASFTTTALTAGAHPITARYPSGSSAFAPSSSNLVTQQVN